MNTFSGNQVPNVKLIACSEVFIRKEFDRNLNDFLFSLCLTILAFANSFLIHIMLPTYFLFAALLIEVFL
ncbi:hypothetical protein HZS_7440 [Henneguya salminicola]|nr:hypothetical protein HZS_7440 [Henneguya salminicola]